MANNKNFFSIYSLQNLTKMEGFWFTLGASFGLWCGLSVFNLSLTNLTINSYLTLMGIAFIYGMTYKDFAHM